MIEHLTFSDGPKRVGAFSHAVKSDNYLFVTGQMPSLKDNTSKLISTAISRGYRKTDTPQPCFPGVNHLLIIGKQIHT